MSKRRVPCPNRCDSEGILYGGVCAGCGGKGWVYEKATILPLPPVPVVKKELTRAGYHEMLDRAMNATPEGESFVGRFVDLIVKEARGS